jgi:hypothetical protein
MNKYINQDNCTSVEFILNEYKKTKMSILSDLLTNPSNLVDNWCNLLSIDHDCRSRINKGEMEITRYNTDLVCINCENMKIVNENDEKTPFKIADEDYMIIESKINRPVLEWINKNKINGDSFTIKILITWYIEKIFNDLSIPAISLCCGYICGNYGFLLYKIPTINNELCNLDCLFDILEEQELILIIDGILRQIIVIYDVLRENQIILGQSNRMSFLTEHKPCDYTYKNINVKCDYTIYLSNLALSQAKINKIDYSVKMSGSELMINTFYDKLYQKKSDCYKINKYDCNLKHKLPLSVDFYLLLSSLIEDPYFYHIIKHNENAFDLWKKCWVDYDDVLMKLKNSYENENQNELLKCWLYEIPINHV